MNRNLHFSNYLPFALLYFFLNSIFLPEGLLYTSLLTPFFLWWLYRQGTWKPVGWFFLLTIPFVPIHLKEGVSLFYYARSYLSFFSAWVFGVCFFVSLKKEVAYSLIFRQVLTLNFLLVPLALAALLLPPLKGAFWYLKEISPGVGTVPRLKMFTYEASYYALLLAPLCIYFYLRLLLHQEKHRGWVLLMATLPLGFSFSLGVIGAMIIGLALLAGICPELFFRRRELRNGILIALGSLVLLLLLATLLYPHNPLFERMGNIFHGKDTSFRGRTYESFILAWKVAKAKSLWFGCGPGQVKIAGIGVFLRYYGYLPPVVRIPNTLADTMATYGVIGLAVRLGFTIYFFFRTRVWNNYYRLWLFFFLFIYQLTGSFMTNIAEYVIWLLAFTNAFTEFDRSNLAAPISEIRYRPCGEWEMV